MVAGEVKAEQAEWRRVAAAVAARDRRRVPQDVLADEDQTYRRKAQVDPFQPAGYRAERRPRQAGKRDGCDRREERRPAEPGRGLDRPERRCGPREVAVAVGADRDEERVGQR